MHPTGAHRWKSSFSEDLWEREGGGGGRTRVIQQGAVLEKGGVSTSQVHGDLPEEMKKQFGVEQAQFFAAGISLVLHPEIRWPRRYMQTFGISNCMMQPGNA